MQKYKISFSIRGIEYGVELSDRQVGAIANTLGIVDSLFNTDTVQKVAIKAIFDDKICDELQTQLLRYGLVPALPSIVNDLSNAEIQAVIMALLAPMAEVQQVEPIEKKSSKRSQHKSGATALITEV